MPKEIWGIKIVPQKPVETVLEADYLIKFETFVSPYSKVDKNIGEMFVTNPALREVIKKNGFGEKKLGAVSVIVDETSKMLKVIFYYPFSGYKATYDIFKGIGIGSLIDLRIEKFLLKRFKGFNIKSVLFPKPLREKQYNARRRKIGEPIPIKEAYNLTGEYVKRKTREYVMRENPMVRRKLKQRKAKKKTFKRKKTLKK